MARTAWDTQYPVAICDTAPRGGRLSVPALTSHPSPQPQGREGPVCGAHHRRSKSSQHILPVAFSRQQRWCQAAKPGALAEKVIHRSAWKGDSRKFGCSFLYTAGCTVIEPTSLAVHTSLLRKPPEQALVYSKCCGSTALQTAVGAPILFVSE